MKQFMQITELCFFIICLGVASGFAKEWQLQKIPDTAQGLDLRATSFVDSRHGFAVGEKGVVLTTADGGQTWKDLTAGLRQAAEEYLSGPVNIELDSVMFIDAETGWCAGSAALASMQAADISYKTIFFTNDGGATWICRYPLISPADPAEVDSLDSGRINDIFFADKNNGRAVGSGFSYLATDDGGLSWEERWLGGFVIPEMRMTMTSSRWLSSGFGAVVGYTWDMNESGVRNGFIVEQWSCGDPDNSGKLIFFPDGLAALKDIEVVAGKDNLHPSAWAVGEQGLILKRTPDGWKQYLLNWPNAFNQPDFNGLSFADNAHGWAVGSFRGLAIDGPEWLSILKTRDAGKSWLGENPGREGRLNDVAALNGRLHSADESLGVSTDVWAVGDNGLILHYHNNPPVVCGVSVEPQMVNAGDKFIIQARVDDLDDPFTDIAGVTVDAASIGAGLVELEYVAEEADSRRCILYQTVIETPPLAEYGSHYLPVFVVDNDDALAWAETDVFVVTSWVEILDTWAEPAHIAVGGKVQLTARVILNAPKSADDDTGSVRNRIESVQVNISDLLGLDCGDDADCSAWTAMKYDSADNLYKVVVEAAIPGRHNLPVVAEDTLGHGDKDFIQLCVLEQGGCVYDFDHDNDVDGLDIVAFVGCAAFDDFAGLAQFAGQFGRYLSD